MEVAALLQAVKAQNEALLDALKDQRQLLLGLLLGDAEIAFNIFQVIGIAERLNFSDNGTVATTATRTFTLTAPPGHVGFVEVFNVDVSVEQQFAMVIDFDGKEIHNDQALTSGDIDLPTKWFPFKDQFRVRMTNNDPLGQNIKIQGPRTFMREVDWTPVRQTLEDSLRMVLGR